MKRKLSSDNLFPTDEHFADDTSTKEDSVTSRLQEITVNANNGEIRETIQILCLVILVNMMKRILFDCYISIIKYILV